MDGGGGAPVVVLDVVLEVSLGAWPLLPAHRMPGYHRKRGWSTASAHLLADRMPGQGAEVDSGVGST